MSINKAQIFLFRCDGDKCTESTTFWCELPVGYTIDDVYEAYKESKDYMPDWTFNSRTGKLYCRYCCMENL